jgi:hypothetical protein
MRSVAIPALLLFAFCLVGCAQTRSAWSQGKQQVASLSQRVRGCPPPCAPAPCAPQPICYTEPVYASCCGGDNGIGRGGTGAFKIP